MRRWIVTSDIPMIEDETSTVTANRKQVNVVVERYPDTYIAYPIGIEGVVVGQGSTFEEALKDATSATRFHIETFGLRDLPSTETPLHAPVER